MTSQLAPTVRRALAAFLALGATVLTAVSLAVLTAAPAAAEVPAGWSDPDPVDPVFVLLVAVGLPLLGALVITAMVYGPPRAPRPEVPVAAGDPFTASERAQLDATIRRAEQTCRAEISVFVGNAEGEDPRVFATQLHNTLVAPSRSILVMVDPTRRLLEVVTGAHVRRHLTDAEVEIAVLHMRTDFATGDLAGGLRRGIEMLAEHARPPRTLHSGA